MKFIFQKICPFFVILISFQGYSQIDINIEFSGGINNNMAFLVPNNQERYNRIDDLLSIEPYFVYSSGVNFQYHFEEKNSLVLGFNFENNSFKVNQENKYIVNNYFLTIPVIWNYFFNERIGLKSGIQNKILLSSPKFPESIVNYNLSILFGLVYKINSKFNISANIYSDLTPYNKIELIYSSQNYYNYGTTVSISYKIFNK